MMMLHWGTTAAAAAASFPAVETSSSGGTTGTEGTSHAITLPAGIQVGDLILVYFACEAVSGISIDTGASGANWTTGEIGTAGGSNHRVRSIYKIAEGSDALTMTTGAARETAYVAVRISGAGTVYQAATGGSSANADPPNLAPGVGSKKFLAIAVASGRGNNVATAAPSGYTAVVSHTHSEADGISLYMAERDAEVSSEDPGTFTSPNVEWVAHTTLVAPA